MDTKSMANQGGALVAAMRPRQWIKSIVLFAALVFDGRLFYLGDLLTVAVAAGLFSLVSSAGYLFNDLRDLEADRLHPAKRTRPIASGHLKTIVAQVTIPAIYIIVFPIAILLSPSFAAVLAAYVVLMYVYTNWLKNFVIVDVLVISIGFLLRAIAGATVVGIPISPWLYVCTLLLALFLALAKRRHELTTLQEDAADHRQNLNAYSVGLLDQLIFITSAAVIIAYSLYTFESPALRDSDLMMLTIPFVIYGVFRYLYLVHQHNVGGAPEYVVLQDRPLLGTLLLWGIASVLILYGPWS